MFKAGLVRIDLEKEPQLTSIVQHHPNVVLVHGLWCSGAANQPSAAGNQPALVMELCSTSLSKYLKEKKEKGLDEYFQLHSKVDILRDVAAGMFYLHGVQIMHGNLSANTVLLNVSESNVVAKVTGFGLSRLLNPDTTMHRKSDIIPPEMKDCREPAYLTKAVDVFSFGCLIPHVASCVVPDLSRYPLGWWLRSTSIAILIKKNFKLRNSMHICYYFFMSFCNEVETIFLTLIGAFSDIKKHASYIKDNEKHVLCTPLMETCLAEIPEARMTFGDVIDHLKKYSKRSQVPGEENEMVRLK